MEELKVIIVEDEERMRITIRHLLQMYYPHAKVVAEAANVKTAATIIRQHNPDVVLLDVEMPDGTGFDLIKQLHPISFRLIFITAYDQYAIQAIRFSALDYLLKPVNPDELVRALDKASARSREDDLELKITNLMNNMATPARRILLKTQEALHLVAATDIISCEADRNYTRFIMRDGKSLLVTGSLIDYEEMLSGMGFFRPHQSYLVQLNCIIRFEKSSLMLVMSDGSKVPVAVRKKEQLLELLEKM